jgi:hypothetical protein
MSNIKQRIDTLRRWVATGDPQLQPEWDHIDMVTMDRRGLTDEQYAMQCISNFDAFINGGDE